MGSFTKCLVIIFMVKLSIRVLGQNTARAESKFRILAPEFICPKDENTVVEKPDNTIITLQTAADSTMEIAWTVRWSPLAETTQRFTLMLWKTVRELEKHLNKPPAEPYVYVIENSELLPGVDYIFNVSSIEQGAPSEPKTFHIDNTQDEQKLMIEGRNDMLSVVLVGAQIAYVDDTFVLEALVTTCQPTQDYYFVWTVQSLATDETVPLPHIQGSRLEVPPCSLKVGWHYNVYCRVMRLNNGDLITLTNLPFSVQHRGLEAYLNVDHLEITINRPFTMETTVISHDYCDAAITYDWECTHSEESCTKDIVIDNGTLLFPSGLTDLGEYRITLTVNVADQTAVASATVLVVNALLPVISIYPLSKMLNENTAVTIVANTTSLTPSCSLAWYFATEEYLTSLNLVLNNDTCYDCQHGEQLSDTVTIYSLEEQFLSELADFTNETETWQATATFRAQAGRARLVASCECSLTFNCETLGSVHADVWFHLNESPKAKDVMISPESGTALETIFRISTLAAVDQHTPLRYSFYCSGGRDANDTILLASYTEHRAVETLLPYVATGTLVWVEVCDALGACSKGSRKRVKLTPGEARTVNALVADARAHAMRCEMALLARAVQSAIVTYVNADQSEALTKFIQPIQRILSRTHNEECFTKYHKQYLELMFWLETYGFQWGGQLS